MVKVPLKPTAQHMHYMMTHKKVIILLRDKIYSTILATHNSELLTSKKPGNTPSHNKVITTSSQVGVYVSLLFFPKHTHGQKTVPLPCYEASTHVGAVCMHAHALHL